MKKTSRLFSSSPLLLIPLTLMLLLAACSPTPPGEQTTEDILPTPTLAESTPVETLPTDALPAPTEAPAELPTQTPEPVLATETLPAPTETPIPIETVNQLQVALLNTASEILLWRESDQALSPLVVAANAIDVRLSDDGTLLAYRKTIDLGQQELWVVNTDGTNLRMLLSVDALRAFDPVALGVTIFNYEWIPGTHTLAFNTLQFIDGPGTFLYDDLHFIQADSGELTTQLTAGSGGTFAFSPDGQQYAIIKPESISLHNTDGSNIRTDVMTYPYVLTYSEYQYYAEPVWSPDSSFLLVAIPPQDSLGEPDALTQIWNIPTDGSPANQLGEIHAQPFFIDPVRFSPDLTQVAFTRLPDPTDYATSELVIAKADGSSETIYATGNLLFTSWATDSRHFVFENGAIPETDLGQVGATPTALTDIAYSRDIYWLDDNRFLFLAQSEGGWQIRLGVLGETSTLIVELPNTYPIFDFDK